MGIGNDYQQRWLRYRQFRTVYVALFVGFVPVMFPVGVVIEKVFRTAVPAFILAGIWMVAMVVVGFLLSSWRCPRCNKWFAATWWSNHGFFARKCVHCGLPKYASGPDVRREGTSTV